ncbi:MAG TPA: ABC transporter permease [Agromyces sp.]|nr:ABC transporter permease [Agromyces sp.]
MVLFLAARFAWTVVLFLVITLFTFVVFFVVPQPQVRAPGRGGNTDPIDIRDSIALHGSLPSQYVQFVWNFVTDGSLGRSYYNRQEVSDIVRRAAPITISVVAGGVVFWLLLAIPIGVLSALRPRSLLDRSAMVFVLIGVSAHPAWLGLVLGHIFGYRLQWLPFSGYCEMFSPTTICGGPAQWAWHLILPWFTFAFLYAALYARMIRASVIETMEEDYVRTARAKGSGEAQVLRGHVFRNSMLPIVTMLGMDLGTALGGVIFIESVFNLPGLGGILRSAITQRDLPVVLGVVTYTTVAILMLNLIVDILYAILDPRVRLRTGMRTSGRTRTRGAGSASAPAPAPATPTG